LAIHITSELEEAAEDHGTTVYGLFREIEQQLWKEIVAECIGIDEMAA
jgi:hypothetical protein